MFKTTDMTLRRVGLFVDHDNMAIAARRQAGPRAALDYLVLLAYAARQGRLVESVLVMSRAPWNRRHRARARAMRALGFTDVVADPLRWVVGRRHKSAADVALAVRVGIAIALRRFDHLILASGDGDFVPIIRLARARGVAIVEIVTPGAGSTSRYLVRAASRCLPMSNLAGLVIGSVASGGPTRPG